MKTVWKFTLEVTDDQEIEMPEGAEILFLGQTYPGNAHIIEVWALVDPNAPRVQRRFAVEGTGHPVTEGGTHVGSIISLALGSPLVWHVFDHGET